MSKGGREAGLTAFEQGKRAVIAMMACEKQKLPPYAQSVALSLIAKAKVIGAERSR